MKFVVYRRADDDWGWRLIAKRGGKTIADSAEGYRRGHDISVSDFVFPSYFDPQASGPYDYLNVLAKPFSIAKGGYLIVRKTGPEGQKFGRDLEFNQDDLPPAWLSPVKLHPAARTARRLTP